MASTAAKSITITVAIVVAAAIVIGIQIWPPMGGGVKIGGPFELVDQNGRTRTEADFRGKLMLVYFGYTYCPDVCPTELQKMSVAVDELGADAAKVQPIFVTVDPARDTPERLKEYAKNFNARLIALTGDAEAIKKAASAYRIYYAKAKGSGEADYLMDHSSIVYLMGPDGRYLTHFTSGTSIEDMAAQIRQHMS